MGGYDEGTMRQVDEMEEDMDGMDDYGVSTQLYYY